MSIQGNYIGGLERPEMTRLTTTSATTVKSAQNGQTTIGSIGLANETGSAVVVELHYNDGTTDFLYWKEEVPANEAIKIEGLPLRLYVNDVLKATAATSNAITVYPATIVSSPNEPAR